jgi:hypothetical protein
MLMAPPIPGLRPPVQARGRTATDVMFGLLAVIALGLLTIGLPIALLKVLGAPIPHKLLSGGAFTQQLDVMAILRILSVIVWLLWVQLVWCVIVEITAAVRHAGTPGRVPLAGATQSAAHRLVAAALLLFSAAAVLSPAFAHAGPPRAAHSISRQVQDPRLGGRQPIMSQPPDVAMYARAPAHMASTHATHSEKIYVVRPPAGRYHESLWEIAQNHLGDGRRYHEIFQLNKDHVQPDGARLTIASLIRPGWVLRMPADAYGPGIEVVSHGVPAHQDAASDAGHAVGMTDGAGAAPAEAAGGSVARPTTGHSTATYSTSGQSTGGQSTAGWPYELASAGLLAAGVLVSLGRHRRRQLWQRGFGRRLLPPEGAAAVAEEALRLGADDPAVKLLDVSLRQLSAAMAAQGKTPPTVFAAHLGTENLDLWVAPPDPNPPRPWLASADGQVWRLPVSAVASLEPAETLAPYPGLVSIGTNESGRIMVDLEVAHGLICVRGPERTVQAALAALAVELITNRWSDRMRVTLVGFGQELALLSPERVAVAATLEDALPALEQRSAELTRALSAPGMDSVLTGRSVSADTDAWAPHYLIMGVPPSPEQADRLLALAHTRHRTALGFVVAGDVPGATWTWDVTEDGRLTAPELGFNLAAQLLPAAQYAALISLFRGSRDAPVTDPALRAAPGEHLVPGARVCVDVGLLGPVTVSAPGWIEPERLALVTELVAYLAAHPGGVHLNVLTGAVWPRGVPAEVRDATLARVKGWLGADASGQPNLVTDDAGRLRFGPGVRVDWQVFCSLVAGARDEAGSAAAQAGDEMTRLEQALGLIRGQPLDGHDPARYAWLGTDDFLYEVGALVGDTAHRLSALRLSSGNADGAMEAARAGLRLAFNDEMLWRDLLLGAHVTGQEQVLRAVVDEVCARTALDEVMPRMSPETEALIDELLPSWRSSAA